MKPRLKLLELASREAHEALAMVEALSDADFEDYREMDEEEAARDLAKHFLKEALQNF